MAATRVTTQDIVSVRAVDVDSEAATVGQVLTANGTGGATFAAAGAAAANPISKILANVYLK